MNTKKPSEPQIQAEDFTGLCMAIGYICQNWASLEQNIDMWIAWIYHKLGGRTKINTQIPLSFSRKIDFLRLAFNKVAALKPLADEAKDLLSEAKKLSDKRNDLIHGALSNLSPINGKWHMIIFDYETPKDKEHWHVLRNFTFSPSDFQEIEAKLVPLVTATGKFGHRLIDIVV